MQTERVTFLTSPDHKAALDAFAAHAGQSVGQVVRDATVRYMEQPATGKHDDAAVDRLIDELAASIPAWNARFDSMEASIARARRAIGDALLTVDATK